MASARSFTFYGRMTEALRREAKKAAVLTFLLTVLGVLWVRMAMKNGDTPAVANAAPSGKQLAAALEGKKDNDQVAAASFKNWINAPLGELNRNLFSVNLDHFPQEYRTTNDAVNNGGGFWGELAKSVAAKAD